MTQTENKFLALDEPGNKTAIIVPYIVDIINGKGYGFIKIVLMDASCNDQARKSLRISEIQFKEMAGMHGLEWEEKFKANPYEYIDWEVDGKSTKVRIIYQHEGRSGQMNFKLEGPRIGVVSDLKKRLHDKIISAEVEYFSVSPFSIAVETKSEYVDELYETLMRIINHFTYDGVYILRG